MISSVGTRTRRAAALGLGLAVAAGAFALPGAASAKPVNVKVMTRNIYLGADLTPALLAPNPPAAFRAAGGIYEQMLDTNFVARSRVLADEVAASRPDLIGLQEVALWRRGQLGAPDGDATPAEEVVVDFLDELTNRLSRRGLQYRVAVSQTEADLELPVDRTDDSTANPTFDGRLTMRDVILAKRGLRLRNPRKGNFGAFLEAPTALGPVQVARGFTSIDVRKGKRRRNPPRFRFVNTHLEAFNAFIRNAQAGELVSAGGVTATSKPVILLGDLNSDPDDPTIDPNGIPTANAAAYETVAGAGFADRGVTVPTCCHEADLRNAPPATFDSRIDHVLSKGTVNGLSASLLGVDPAFRTPTNLWPSDHGGVVATLRVR